MTKAQRIYRLVRPFASRADARYFAARVANMSNSEFTNLSAIARA